MRDDILNKIIKWSDSESLIRMAILEGSLARGTYVDELSDIDVNLWVTSYDYYMGADTWLSEIGKVLVYIPEKFQAGHKTVPTRLVIFEGGVKVDFSFWTLDLLDDIENGILAYNGYQVLLDKDNRSESLGKPQFIPGPFLPAKEEEYQKVVNEFWYEIHYIAKSLKRDELWFAHYIDSGIKERQLLKILEWFTQIKYGMKKDTHYLGRHMKDWLDQDMLQKVNQTFAGHDKEQNWHALFTTVDVFRNTAIYIADKQGFFYPYETDRNMSSIIEQIYRKN